ncbi:MAG TPA: hypothetical protein VF538_03170 [Pyrinomonadaceae bacterium]|jgi:hypothetical protein
MRTLRLLPPLLTLIALGQSPAAAQDGSPVAVLGFKWAKTRQQVKSLLPDGKSPARAVTPETPMRAVIPENKANARNARINDPMGTRDPNADTIDGRSAALDQLVREANTPKAEPVDGYAYRVRVQNASAKVVEVVFWEYQFIDPANPESVARRQFLCGVNIKPDKEKELQAFSSFGPTDVINAARPGDKSENAFREKVLINRVEYKDGSAWQRKDWDDLQIKQTYKTALATPWSPQEMCRRL